MTAIPRGATREVGEVFYPSADGQPMAETAIHVLLMLGLIEAIRRGSHARQDVYTIGNTFLYYEEGNPEARRSPDVMVVKGVPRDPPRPSFKVWQEKAVPCVVIELTSASTADEDLGPKKELYERLGVREYFLFDPLGEYLPRPLVAYRLVKVAENGNGDPLAAQVHDRYEELPPDAEGGVPSAELGLRLVPRGIDLVLIDLRTGEPLPTPENLRKRLAQSERDLAQKERELKKREQDLKQSERRLRQQLEQQLADLQAKLAALTPPPEGKGS